MVFEQLGPGQDKRAPAQMGSAIDWAPGQMGFRQTGQGNNCPGPIRPRITNAKLLLLKKSDLCN